MKAAYHPARDPVDVVPRELSCELSAEWDSPESSAVSAALVESLVSSSAIRFGVSCRLSRWCCLDTENAERMEGRARMRMGDGALSRR